MISAEFIAQFQEVSKFFSKREVFRNLSYKIPVSGVTSLLGPSGCGKSTLLRLIAGLEDPSSGALLRAENFADSFFYVFQDAQLLPWRTALENVCLPLELGPHRNKFSQSERLALGRAALKKVHLQDFESHFPQELSGGMKMRVSLARGLVTRPKILLMDEPFSALDEATRFEMQDQLRKLVQDENLSVVFVTHSISEALYLSDRILVLKGQDASLWQDIAVNFSLPRKADLRHSEEFNTLASDLSKRALT